MTEQELIELCSLGESTTVQYKLEFTTQKQIAEELVAFANTRGGIIVFGAEDKTGRMVGLTYEQVQYTSRELGNTANEQVRPVIYIETETVKHEGMAYVIAYVKNGIYKPYKDLSGNIWVKQGSDKRRVTENSEIRRLLQNSHQYQVDADGVEGSSEDNIDTDNRIEIVNPGCLPDGQTIDEMLLGNSDPRNPLLAQFGSNTMPYRGLGSGIPRVMATGSDVELIDRPDGNQFVARIWRTTQKDETTTQKANEALISTTQKEEPTTQKSKIAAQKPLNATQKKILAYLHNYPKATRKETADALGDITEDGVKFNIGLLQQYGALKRKGGRKNGEWEVNPDYFSEFIEI